MLLGTSRIVQDEVSMCPASGVVLWDVLLAILICTLPQLLSQGVCVCGGGGGCMCVCVCVCVFVYYTYTSCTGDSHQFWNELASIFEDFLFNDM